MGKYFWVVIGVFKNSSSLREVASHVRLVCVRTFVWNYPGIISQLSLKLAQAKPKDDA